MDDQSFGGPLTAANNALRRDDKMNQQNALEINTTIMRVFLWSGVVMVIALIVVQGLVMGFIPPPSPTLSAGEIAQIFHDRQGRILTGALLQIIFWTFYGTWNVPMIALIRKMERGMPLLTMASTVFAGGGWVIVVLIPMTWAVAAFRVGEVDPQLIQILNDWTWFLWLYTWPPFSVWMLIVAAAILQDRSSPTVLPRWFAYYNMWTAILIFPAGMIGFFKTGPFALDGLIAFWFSVIVFFGWMVTSTTVMFRALAVIERQQHVGVASQPLHIQHA
jgi:hypothetical protein